MTLGLQTGGYYASSASSGNIFSKAKKTTKNGYSLYTIDGIGYGSGFFENTTFGLKLPPIDFSVPRFTTSVASSVTKSKQKESQGIFSKIGSWAKDAYNTVSGFISGLGKSIISTAAKYLGFNEANGSYKKFTNGRTEAWCADFVTYVIKETFRLAGKVLPSGFGSPSVSVLMEWGKKAGRWIQTAGKSNKASIIKSQVKPGDIIIFKSSGASHTGIVERIDANGKIHTIEGNTSDKVARRSYSPDKATITGFIKMA